MMPEPVGQSGVDGLAGPAQVWKKIRTAGPGMLAVLAVVTLRRIRGPSILLSLVLSMTTPDGLVWSRHSRTRFQMSRQIKIALG